MREVKRLESYVENIACPKDLDDIISVEHRSNNSKRDFLFVNRYQCKHIPCSTEKLYKMCEQLAEQVYKKTKDKSILVIGFAETATAIANIIAEMMPNIVYYMQTTRENIDPEKYKFIVGFSEEHSHAPSQKLVSYKTVKQLVDTAFDYVVFIDDEITTGKTILNCVSKFSYYFPDKSYGVASICNWQSEDDIENFNKKGIDRFSLISGQIRDKNKHMELSEDEYTDTCTIPTDKIIDSKALSKCNRITLDINTYMDERLSRCEFGANNDITINKRNVATSLIARIVAEAFGVSMPYKKLLIVGTEEFMSIPCKVAETLRNWGYDLKVQATTRSPISIIDGSAEFSLEICNKAGIVSAYDKDRKTFLYNLKFYHKIVVITDGEPSDEFYLSILNGFGYVGVDPENITFIRLVR